MTMLAGVGAKLGAFATQRVVQIAAAGVLSGAVAGTAAVVAGVNPLGPPARGSTVSLLACPGSGAELARVPEGQTMLVVARSVDGHWLEVYVGQPGINRAWVPAKGVKLQQAGDSLPVDDCVETAAALPSAAPLDTFAPDSSIPAIVTAPPVPTVLPPGVTPGPTPRVTPAPTLKPGQTPPPTPKVTPTPTPLPPPPTIPPATPTPTPVPTADNISPVISNLQVTNTCLGPDLTSTTMTVMATDNTGVASVGVSWIAPGGVLQQSSMKYSGGTTWQLVIVYNASWSSGYISYTVTAKDAANNSSNQLHNNNSSTNNLISVQPSGCVIG